MKIFLPTDFSESADAALEMAVKLAEKTQAELHLAHGFSPGDELITADLVVPFQGVPGTMGAEQVNQFIEDRIASIKKELATRREDLEAKGFNVQEHLLDSGTMQGISGRAKELGCDLVVMGSNGAKGMGEKLIGSQTQKFIRYSEIPVLVCKAGREKGNFYNVAFCSTFQHEGEAEVYQRYRDLFVKFPIHTHFLYVNTPGNFETTPRAEHKIASFLKDTWPSSYETHIYNDHSTEEGILNFADEHGIDMIVMATRGQKGLQRLFASSTTESLINHSSIPVLSFNLSN